ncbi:hypothetical protein L5515_012055 [Caenorhabditis briggsae]|uniref:Uncharacterized protein n=1 Tax=Caenorhabditis briggsae TaxID=6238 RepID=A0AAE9JIG3_CAEBR|nr:hypothetical protein L5515_012055 [Caenorhabditis briggsae]
MNESTSTISNDELQLDFVGLGPVEFPVYDSDEYWGREVPYAVFILIFCIFFIILQFLVMRVMITDKDLKKLPAFQIMFMISFFDTIQLFVHLTAVFYILNSKPHFNLPDYSAKPLSAFLRTVSANISLVDVLFSLFAHVSIFSYIYFKAALLSRKELILTIQVVCVSVFHVIGYLTWEYFPIPWDLPIGVFIGHVVWMVWNAINPMLYVLINPSV